MSNLTSVVQQLRKERDQLQGRIEQLDEALKALTGRWRTKARLRPAVEKTKNHVSSGAQTDRCRPARALGEMEGSSTA